MQFYLLRSFLHPSIKIETDDVNIAYVLSVLYGAYLKQSDFSEECDLVCRIEHYDEKYVFECDNHNISTDNPIQVIENILFEQTRLRGDIFALHAGAVSHNGKAYIFVAPTSTGITTLTAYLSLSGFDYVTDDCVLIDMNSFKVYPYHKPIHLREGGMTVLKNYGFEPDMIYIDEKTIQRYVFTPMNLSSGELDIGGIFFIERTKDINKISVVSSIEAIQLLMKSPITPYEMTGEYLKFICSLTKRNCRRLQYGDMAFVKDYIMRSINEQ